MRKPKAIILFLFVLVTQAVAQDTLHLCVGESHDFAVPYNIGSNYDWKLENTAIATISYGTGPEHIIIDLISSGIFQLIVEELKPNGCFGYDSVLVEIHDTPNPMISALGPTYICQGVDVLLKLNNVYESYLWNNGSSLSELSANIQGDYSVIVTDKFGCVNTSNSILIDVQSDFFADFIFDGICINNPTFFSSTSSSLGTIINSLTWDFGNGFQSFKDSVSYSYNVVGDYLVSLSVETAAGCKDSTVKTVSIFGSPKANFNYNPYTISTLKPEINFLNTSVDGSLYLWDFGDSIYSVIENPTHIYEDPGVYNVMLIIKDINECLDSVSKNIIMYYDFVLHMPNSFTPNDDGENDMFGPQGLRMDKYISYEFLIFNRWGDIIFETNDINDWWDGANHQHGTYLWAIVIVDELGKVRKKVGDVLLIK